MFLPLVIIKIFVQSDLDGIWFSDLSLESLRVPWSLAFKGLGVMLLTSSTLSTMTPFDFTLSVLALRLPSPLAFLCQQILHQTGMLIQETQRIALSIALRGLTQGWRLRLKIVKWIPLAWLPRVTARAERVALAMELRDFLELAPRNLKDPISFRDLFALLAGAAILATQIGLNLWD